MVKQALWSLWSRLFTMSGEVQDSGSGPKTSSSSLKFSIERLLRKSPCRKKRKLHRLANGNFTHQIVRENIQEDKASSNKNEATAATAADGVTGGSLQISPSLAAERALSPDTTFSHHHLGEPDHTTEEDCEDIEIDGEEESDVHDEATHNQDSAKPSKPDEKKKSKPKPLPCSPGYLVNGGVTVELLGQSLWKKFYKLGTEMIITKAGRRMFPTLKVRVSGLDPTKTYIFALEIVPFDDKRYRYVYHSSQWMIAGAGDPPPATQAAQAGTGSSGGTASVNTFLHGDSPSSGEFWQSQSLISFDKLKLTNNRASIMQGQTCLHSMHKYLPKIHIKEIDESSPLFQDLRGSRLTPELLEQHLDQILQDGSLTFTFPETAFTTVTAYQNQQITKLKIASNPFAKGFRESTRSRDHHNTFNPAAISAFYNPHFLSQTPHHPQFIHPRHLLEANQQIQMATQQLQLLAPVLHQTMKFHQPRQIGENCSTNSDSLR